MKHQWKNIVFPFSNDLTQRLESIFSGSKIQNLSAFAKTSGNQSVKQKDERMFLWLQKNSKLQYKFGFLYEKRIFVKEQGTQAINSMAENFE